MSFDVGFFDRAAKKAHTGMSIKLPTPMTSAAEAAARLKVLNVASRLSEVTGACVTGTVLRYFSDNLPHPAPGTGDYRTIEDHLKFGIQPIGGGKTVPTLLPSPKPTVLLPDKETVDAANVAVQDFFSAVVGWAVDYGKRKLLEYVEARRERGKMIALPPGETLPS